MSKYRIKELQNPERYIVIKRHWLFPFYWKPVTFGDGCGNNTGIKAIFKTLKEAEEYEDRCEKLDEWFRGL